jgi:demethylmenaquinone methyltransferase/2-methoxy-6-polyprenyl-1,4-benzoquinol methylase
MHPFFDALKNSKAMNLLFKAAGASMESRARHFLMNPETTLHGADILPGATVLEVGCGTGFFTLPAARLIGEQGRLVAMDALPAYVERVSRKSEEAGLSNVTVFEGDALDTGLDSSSFDAVILFGVIPLVHLWVPKAIVRSGLFNFVRKRNGVLNYRRLP